MYKTKLLASLLLALSLAVTAVGPALAAQDPAPLIGVVEQIVPVTDPITKEVTVEVTLTIGGTQTETVVIGLADAVTLGLVLLDPITQEPSANPAALQTEVTIPAAMILPADDATDGEGEHPIARLLADFFGIDYDVVAAMHDEGTGFGVIAQSCWASYQLAGDASLCEQIALAKQSGDYSSFTLPDGSTPTNWGQFRKALKEQRTPLETLGAIRSGRAGEEVGNPGEPTNKNDRPDKGNNGNNGNNGNHGNPDNKGNRPNK